MMRVWCNVALPAEALELLAAEVGTHRLVIAAGQSPPPQDFEVAFGQPSPESLMQSRVARWLHVSTAGYTAYDRPDFRAFVRERQVPVTNSSGVYAEPCAQHALAMMLALARQLPAAFEDQRTTRLWPQQRLRQSSFLLGDQTAVLVGFGTIGARLAELLQPFGMNLAGIRRRPTGKEAIPVHELERADRVLPEADHVVNLLPDSPYTARFFDAVRLGRLKKGSFFYNIGRGTTVDQEALAASLRSGRLQGAYLDVTDPEPLPPDHFLWQAPNCFITPHSAGGQQAEMMALVRHFLENLRRFEAGMVLKDRILHGSP